MPKHLFWLVLLMMSLVIVNGSVGSTSATFNAEVLNGGNVLATDTLEPPTDLAAAANGADIDLTWTATPNLDADGYNVYRSTSSGCCYVFQDSVVGRTTTSYVDVGAGSSGPPVFESVATASAKGTSLVIGKPAGTVDGDLLIAIVSGEDDGATITPPAGWTQIFSLVSSGGFQAVAWYRVASGEPASFTFTSTLSHQTDGGVMRYSNTHPTTPIDVSAAVEDFGNPTAPTVTTTVGNTLVLRVAALEDGTVTDIDYPAGTTGRFEVDGSGGQVVAAADSVQAVAGSTGTSAFTGSTDDYVAATIAIAPPLSTYYYVVDAYADNWTSVYSNEAFCC